MAKVTIGVASQESWLQLFLGQALQLVNIAKSALRVPNSSCRGAVAYRGIGNTRFASNDAGLLLEPCLPTLVPSARLARLFFLLRI